MRTEQLVHPFPPVYDEGSRILILGSFPSAASRGAGFYYGHPRNRFWRVLAALTDEPLPESMEQKRALLLRHGIALWDAYQSCEITGSADASIRRASPNDIAGLLKNTNIKRIFCNGRAAYDGYQRDVFPLTGIAAVPLPSTSPANAAWNLERLIEAWRVITDPVEE